MPCHACHVLATASGADLSFSFLLLLFDASALGCNLYACIVNALVNHARACLSAAGRNLPLTVSQDKTSPPRGTARIDVSATNSNSNSLHPHLITVSPPRSHCFDAS